MRINRSQLDRLRDRARQDVEAGLEHGGVEGCTFAIGHRGEVLWEEGFGAARADTPILLLSITKTVVEAALWALFGKGLSPETPVVEIIPEFMGGTQPGITIAMIETHLGGFAWHRMDHAEMVDRASRLAAFSGWRLDRAPGFYEYNPVNGGWVLAEIIERVSGEDYRVFLRTRVLEPLGLAGVGGVSLGEPVSEQERVLLHRNYMSGYTPDPALRMPMAHGLDTRAGLALGMPGAGGVGTAAGVARLYQAYLHNPSGLWDAGILADARDRVRVEAPDAAGRPMRRSLSFVHAGNANARYGERTFFGPNVSDRAFGHQGQGGQIAWADPATGLSFAYLTNTVVFPPGGCFHPRARTLSALAANILA
ncbi:serine hydrolase domain-containing protein [Sphingomonas oligophenolica]|uniref:Serine hydrolase domain-containing protein n=1 Tax=Sphingomonas oligophenolica TaxID=301154 RepID=A0ABU9YBN7_9SPHN